MPGWIFLTVYGKPLILIFAFWKLHSLSKAAATKGGFCILSQLVAGRSFSCISWSKLIASPLVTIQYLGEHMCICTDSHV